MAATLAQLEDEVKRLRVEMRGLKLALENFLNRVDAENFNREIMRLEEEMKNGSRRK